MALRALLLKNLSKIKFCVMRNTKNKNLTYVCLAYVKESLGTHNLMLFGLNICIFKHLNIALQIN